MTEYERRQKIAIIQTSDASPEEREEAINKLLGRTTESIQRDAINLINASAPDSEDVECTEYAEYTE